MCRWQTLERLQTPFFYKGECTLNLYICTRGWGWCTWVKLRDTRGMFWCAVHFMFFPFLAEATQRLIIGALLSHMITPLALSVPLNDCKAHCLSVHLYTVQCYIINVGRYVNYFLWLSMKMVWLLIEHAVCSWDLVHKICWCCYVNPGLLPGVSCFSCKAAGSAGPIYPVVSLLFSLHNDIYSIFMFAL